MICNSLPLSLRTLVNFSFDFVFHLRKSSVERNAQKKNVALVKKLLSSAGFHVLDGNTHIVPIMINDAKLVKDVAKFLLEKHNIYVQPINYPTVPIGSERLRVTPGALHTGEMILELVEGLCDTFDQLGIARKLTLKSYMA